MGNNDQKRILKDSPHRSYNLVDKYTIWRRQKNKTFQKQSLTSRLSVFNVPFLDSVNQGQQRSKSLQNGLVWSTWSPTSAKAHPDPSVLSKQAGAIRRFPNPPLRSKVCEAEILVSTQTQQITNLGFGTQNLHFNRTHNDAVCLHTRNIQM